jgi:hyperosmotically inducible protein
MNKMSGLVSAVLLAVALLPAAGCSSTKGSAEQMLTDKDVSDKAKMAIYSDPVTKSSEINVNTVKGVVTLSGTVGSKAVMDRAIELARGASGAMSVKNDMVIVIKESKD